MKVAAVVVVVAVVMVVSGQKLNSCHGKRQCKDCIQTPGCAWCINPRSQGGNNCFMESLNVTNFCATQDLQNPHNNLTVLEDKELTGAREKTNTKEGSESEEIIQLKPQRLKLRLRKGVTEKLDIKFRRARDYPVDLYYLMDLSYSMKDDKNTLVNAGDVLSQAMLKLTSQFALGFGSFVDKVMMPFTDTTEIKLQSPCPGCAPPYSFRNDMKLSQSTELFKEKVKAALISGNLDFPEGGFDALMQAMVCTEEIGWRDVARRILVFSTDSKFHHAGDGRLAGVILPNDEQCHLNHLGEHTGYDKYDYPSIGQINRVAQEKNINIIFAIVDKRNQDIYSNLTKLIKTASFGLLEDGSRNIVELIQEQYKKISSEVSLTDNSTESLSIVYRSSCKGGGEAEVTSTCGDIKEDDEVTFHLEITANSCPAEGKGSSIVEVKTLEDRVILDIEFLCSCNCPPDSDTSKCHRHGRPVCGACECYEGYYGEMCQCGGGGDTDGNIEDENAKCFARVDDVKPCMGQGICQCGECRCRDPEVTGTYCECNARKCQHEGTEKCSGHGTCACDTCRCDRGYAGTFCECQDEQVCIQPGSDEVCSGHGKCECGQCKCEHGNATTYTGKYCEDCLLCETGKCDKFEDCVQCTSFGIGPLANDCNKCEPTVAVESLDEHINNGARLCKFEDSEGCYVNFAYRYLEYEKRDEVFVKTHRQCPEPAPILSVVFSVIGAIVAIGVITLIIWKVLTTIHDRREYAKFEQESRNARFTTDENPLYRSAQTTVDNPTFGGGRMG